MTIMLRDLPDGQVELILHRPEVIGVMRDHDMAARFVAFLQEQDPELELAADMMPNRLHEDLDEVADAAELSDETLIVRGRVTAAPIDTASAVRVPVAFPSPKPLARPLVERVHLTDEQREAAFQRIQAGESIAAVAPDFGLTMAQLRGAWANHRRSVQQHIAESGQVSCKLCTKPFTPSISHPETCARCSHE